MLLFLHCKINSCLAIAIVCCLQLWILSLAIHLQLIILLNFPSILELPLNLLFDKDFLRRLLIQLIFFEKLILCHLRNFIDKRISLKKSSLLLWCYGDQILHWYLQDLFIFLFFEYFHSLIKQSYFKIFLVTLDLKIFSK